MKTRKINKFYFIINNLNYNMKKKTPQANSGNKSNQINQGNKPSTGRKLTSPLNNLNNKV